MATAISREYIYPHLLDDERTTSSDLAENHGRAVSHMHYARSGNDLPMLSTDVICEMRAACHSWHDVMGIGKNPAPVPLRLLGAAPQSLPTSAEFKAMIDAAVQEALLRHHPTAAVGPEERLGGAHASAPRSRPLRSSPPDPSPSRQLPGGDSARARTTALSSPSPLALSLEVECQWEGEDVGASEVEMGVGEGEGHEGEGEDELDVDVEMEMEMEMDMEMEVSVEPSSEPPRLLGKRQRVTVERDEEEDEEEDEEAEEQGDDEDEDDMEDIVDDDYMEEIVTGDDTQDHTGKPSAAAAKSHRGSCIATSSSPPYHRPAKRQRTGESEVPAEPTPKVIQVSSSPPTSSPLSASDYQGIALRGLRQLFNDPKAEFKSQEQRDMVTHILSSSEDVIGVLPTGGGKSAIWQITAKLRPDVGAIIVIPFVFPLDEQLQSNLDKGIRSCKWTGASNVPPGNQHIFCQPEHFVMPHFQS